MKKNSLVQIFCSLMFTLLISCGSDTTSSNKAGAKIDYKKHTAVSELDRVENALRGLDKSKVDPNYDLYFDFSSTMKRAVTDKVYSDLITEAIFESDNNTNCYIIGENPTLKKVEGDNTLRKNTFLNVKSYTQTKTYMTANLNNVVSHPDKVSIIFTDFSIDEDKPSVDMNGVKSSFIRGPEYKPQFAKWFNSGGSVKVYGKRSSIEGGSTTPIYVIVFLPAGIESNHKANNIISMLDSKLKDIYFYLHSDFIKVNAEPNNQQLSDYLGLSQKKGGQVLSGSAGEILIYEGSSILNALKKDSKKPSQTFFDGLNYEIDSSAYLSNPEFELVVNEYKAESKDKLSTELIEDKTGFFKNISVIDGNKFQIPLNTKSANQEKYYQTSHFYRIAINAKGTKINFNQEKGLKDLAYNLKSGGQSLLNNCLFESIVKGLDEAVRDNKMKTIYTINTFIKPSNH